jgi:hypothetical protein
MDAKGLETNREMYDGPMRTRNLPAATVIVSHGDDIEAPMCR